MRTLTIAVCVIVVGTLGVQVPLLARGGGGAFGGGGFHGGSIGNAGNVGNHPYYGGGYSGYAYQFGATGFEGDGTSGGSGGGSGVVGYTGTGGGPPEELQDGRGVNKPVGSAGSEGPSWDSDWWARDPHPEATQAIGAAVGTAVASLPYGFDTVYLSSQPYYYYSGTFFRSADAGFEVVAAPIGISVRQIPDGADLITVNGQQYLQSGDVYYQALYSGNGLVYKVVEIPQGQQQ